MTEYLNAVVALLCPYCIGTQVTLISVPVPTQPQEVRCPACRRQWFIDQWPRARARASVTKGLTTMPDDATDAALIAAFQACVRTEQWRDTHTDAWSFEYQQLVAEFAKRGLPLPTV